MALTVAEQIKVRQILKVPADRLGDLQGILDLLTDPDLLAAVRVSLLAWDGVRNSRNPSHAGMIRADVVEWDAKARCESLCTLERQIKEDLAIVLGWELDLSSLDGGIFF